MKKYFLLSLLAFSGLLISQTREVIYETGDTDINNHLREIRAYAVAEYDLFRQDLALKFGMSVREVDRYVKEERIDPADLYYAKVLSSITRKPVDDIVIIYKDKKGWGAVAQQLGIKPGSKQFHQLKGKALSGIGKVKSKNKDYLKKRETKK